MAGLSTYAVYGRRSHEMKQTQTHVVSDGRRGSIVLAARRWPEERQQQSLGRVER